MGCDIHLYVEIKNHETGNWENVKGDFYSDRNYRLFSMLAGVRSYEKSITPISLRRGVPDDASEVYEKIIKEWGVDGHSHSFLTVAELMAYDWTQVLKYSGYVRAKDFADWNGYYRGQGRNPEMWSQSVHGADSKIVTEDEMVQMLRSKTIDEMSNYWCHSEWEQPYYMAAHSLLAYTLPQLWRLGKPDDVRIVFFFDN